MYGITSMNSAAGRDTALRPVLPVPSTDASAWEREVRPVLRARWESLLGHPSFTETDYHHTPRLTSKQTFPEFHLASYQQPTGPGQSQHVLVLRPIADQSGPRPGAVIPFYQAEKSAGVIRTDDGFALRHDAEDSPEFARAFGLHLVRQGFVVACVESFPFNTVSLPPSDESFARWQLAADNILANHPQWTGLGKLKHDTTRALDLLLEQPDIDGTQILLMGHSLGGKMAFYTGCLDERVNCVIVSDFGLPWESTNWEAPWYLGKKRPDTQALAHHELLALLAPRPFFLIAGQTDGPQSSPYLEAARPVYQLYGAENRLTMHNHATGHGPPWSELQRAYAWLKSLST